MNEGTQPRESSASRARATRPRVLRCRRVRSRAEPVPLLRPWCGLMLCAALAACGPGSAQPDAGPEHAASAALRTCAEAATGPVDTAAQFVERLNALPRPVSVACFVASLPRPLFLIATTSQMSAQPAGGRDSPRIFLRGNTLVI